MCLSVAYENEVLEDKIIMKNVQNIRVDGEYIVLVDLMEREQRIKGKLDKVDLMDNYIIIKKID